MTFVKINYKIYTCGGDFNCPLPNRNTIIVGADDPVRPIPQRSTKEIKKENIMKKPIARTLDTVEREREREREYTI